MKNNIIKIFNYIKNDPFNLIVVIMSLLILIFGSLSINFFIILIIVIIFNLIWIIPFIKNNNFIKERIESSDNMAKVKKVKTHTPKSTKTKYSKKGKTKNSSKKKKVGKIILLGALGFFLLCVIIGIIFLVYIVVSADKFDPNKLYTKEASILYDTDGKEFAKLGSEMRQKIKYDEMSEELVNAIVATEDSRFFQHNGFDLPRFLKASMGQALGQSAGGASTLTMQVSKNFLTSTKSSGFEGIKRKFTDIYMSIFQIEKNYSKQEIIEFYANANYLGSGAYGVEAACQTYFGKHAKDLNVSEAALIAGLFQAPYTYDPNINPDQTEKRRLLVLKLMKRHGYINNTEYEAAKALTTEKIVKFGNNANSDNSKYQGFIDTVASDVKEKTDLDPYSHSMKIYTTMNREKQDEINDIMNGKTFNWENDKVDAGTVVLNVKTGDIVAVGSGRTSKGAKSFNNATMMKKQIGSTAKPLFDYGPAIEYNGWNTAHPIIDAPHTYSDGTEINNWDGGYKGTITIRDALIDSRNIPALKTFQSVKNSNIREFVTKLGLSPEGNGTLHEAHSIGGYNGESPLTVAAAYGAFANEGYYQEPRSFTKIVFDNGDKDYENKPEKVKVMSPETAYMITDMLVDTGKSALGRYNNINGATFAAKTGTTNFDEATMKAKHLPSNAVNDLWVAGYDSEYAIAVWYGYDKISDGQNRFGSSQNSRLFQAVAKNFFSSKSKFNKPSGIVEVAVERNCGNPLLPSENTPDNMKTTELFKKGSEPTEVSARYNKLAKPTNVKADVNGDKATITWTKVGTPEALSTDYWSPIVNKAFTLAKDQKQYLGYVMNFNKNSLGEVVYKIYLKTNSGVRLLDTTSGASATVNLPDVSNPTIIVKASYSKFGGCESDGAEVSLKYDGDNIDGITAELNGEATVSVKSGTAYHDYDPPVRVYKDGEAIDATITTTVLDANGNPVSKASSYMVDGSNPKYTFQYKVTYKGKTIPGNFTREVIAS